MSALRAEDYKKIALESFQEAWDLYQKKDWKVYKRNQDDVIYSRNGPNGKKLLMSLAKLDISPKVLHEELFENYPNMMNWYSEVKLSQRTEAIDEHTDIIYQVCNDAMGGLISGRDFISLRHCQNIDGCYVISCVKCEHPSLPVVDNLVRGENIIGGSIIKSTQDPNKCEMYWIVGLDLKLSAPQFLIDREMANTMFRFIKELRQHISQVKQLSKD